MNNNIAPTPTPTPAPRIEYGRTDVSFAWISLLLGYLMMLAWPGAQYPLGMFLFTSLCYGATFYYIKKQGGNLRGSRLVIPVSAVALNLGLLINSNHAVMSAVVAYSFFAYVLWVYTAFDGEKDRSPFDVYLAAGLGKALTVLPFGSFFSVFESSSQIKSATGKQITKTLLRIILGLAIAVVPTIVIILLLSFDEGFSRIVDNIFEFDLSGVFRHIGKFILGIPVAMYLFGLLYSASSGRYGRGIDREKCDAAAKKVRFAPVAMVCAALTPIICLYGIFFFAQLEYFVSAFSGNLPAHFTYAQYAREGFFQLCVVSFLNLIMLACAYIFCRRNDKAPLILKIYCTALSSLTLVLITTALSKMIMYIDVYGLTVKRVLSSWFIILLAAVFICIVIAIFVRKFNLTKALFAVFLVLFALLVFCNVDGMCYYYNANRCIDGTLDISAFDQPEYRYGIHIDQYAVPALDKIVRKSPDTQAGGWAKNQLQAVANHDPYIEKGFFSQNLPSILRENILNRYR
ncbi:MAG: DUF4173 domain-containing protein [Clostridia bacterium]|nr:DUF4173 domain-containing protein [Clostridia bacterium]